MKRTTSDLMRALVADLQPVEPLRPPVTRAALWIGAIAVTFAVVVLAFGDFRFLAVRLHQADFPLECMAAFMTGVLSVLAAFHLSIPGREQGWAWVPAISSAIWLACSGILSYQQWLAAGEPAESVFGSLRCFVFIAGSSVPLIASLFWFLRRSYPLAPVALGAAAALGVAGFASFLLQFFHMATPGPIDLSAHVAAVSMVVASGALLGRRALAG